MRNRTFIIGAMVAVTLPGLGCTPAEVSPAPSVANQVESSEQEMSGREAREHVYVSSDLFAGFLVALDAQKEYWRSQGVDLTPRELMARHGKIGCQRDEAGMIQVTFYPVRVVPGGDVTYIVDPKELGIVKRLFGR